MGLAAVIKKGLAVLPPVAQAGADVYADVLPPGLLAVVFNPCRLLGGRPGKEALGDGGAQELIGNRLTRIVEMSSLDEPVDQGAAARRLKNSAEDNSGDISKSERVERAAEAFSRALYILSLIHI